MREERMEELMVKVADGEATPAETRELDDLIEQRPELAGELEAHMNIQSITDGWSQRLELDLVEDAQKKQRSAENWIGVTLFLAGCSVLSAFGLVELVVDPEVPIWLKTGYGLMGAGTVLLLLSAIRHRLATSKKDKYTEVQR